MIRAEVKWQIRSTGALWTNQRWTDRMNVEHAGEIIAESDEMSEGAHNHLQSGKGQPVLPGDVQ